MYPRLSIFGTLLRLIGISSPEDTTTDTPKSGNPAPHPPSWRDPAPPPIGDSRPNPPAA